MVDRSEPAGSTRCGGHIAAGYRAIVGAIGCPRVVALRHDGHSPRRDVVPVCESVITAAAYRKRGYARRVLPLRAAVKIAVIHDYADALRRTRAYDKLKGHEVVVHTDAYTDPNRVVEQVAGCDALVLTQQRVPLTRAVIEKLPQLKFISQTGGNVYHIDVPACTEHGIVISAPSRGGA